MTTNAIPITRNLPCFIAAQLGLDVRIGETANMVTHMGVDSAAASLRISPDECEARWQQFLDVLYRTLQAGQLAAMEGRNELFMRVD